jgi:hypothetical protein
MEIYNQVGLGILRRMVLKTPLEELKEMFMLDIKLVSMKPPPAMPKTVSKPRTSKQVADAASSHQPHATCTSHAHSPMRARAPGLSHGGARRTV